MTSPSNNIIWELEQGSLEWFELRNHRYPASESGAVMEVNPWSPKDRRELAAYRRGELHVEENFAMNRGIKYEQEARDWLSNHLEMGFRPCVALLGDHYMASLDGLSENLAIIAEIKVPMNVNKLATAIGKARAALEADEAYSAVLELLPQNYVWQMVQQCACVPSASRIVFCAYDPTISAGYYLVLDADRLRSANWPVLEAAWEEFRGSNYEPLTVDMSEDEAWTARAKAWHEANQAYQKAMKDNNISGLKKAVDAAADELKKACQPGITNVGHGIKVGYSDVPPKASKGYVMKRISGKFA